MGGQDGVGRGRARRERWDIIILKVCDNEAVCSPCRQHGHGRHGGVVAKHPRLRSTHAPAPEPSMLMSEPNPTQIHARTSSDARTHPSWRHSCTQPILVCRIHTKSTRSYSPTQTHPDPHEPTLTHIHPQPPATTNSPPHAYAHDYAPPWRRSTYRLLRRRGYRSRRCQT